CVQCLKLLMTDAKAFQAFGIEQGIAVGGDVRLSILRWPGVATLADREAAARTAQGCAQGHKRATAGRTAEPARDGARFVEWGRVGAPPRGQGFHGFVSGRGSLGHPSSIL